MRHKTVPLVAFLLVTASLFPSAAMAQQGASAAIANARFASENGGVTFYVDFHISNHAGALGKVRLTLMEGIDALVAERGFRPESSPASFRAFAVHVPYRRFTAEGLFRREELHASVEIFSEDGRLLARESGLFVMPRTRPRQI